MASPETSPARVGLRERKKQQTRDAIARVALRLFAERGYDHTTLADIADAADVSKRTIFAYFDSKEDILFAGEPSYFELIKHKLEDRPPGATTVDALRDFLGSIEPPDENMRLRKQIISANEGLCRREQALHAGLEELFAGSIAKDLDAAPDDIRPPLVAASMTAAFTTLRDRLEAESGEPLTHEQTMAILDEVLEFLRGGLETLRRGSGPS